MSDSLKSPLITVTPIESASVNGVKNHSIAAKSSEDDAFSRVLDRQQDRDAASESAAETAAERRARRRDQNGNALPQERTTAAAADGRDAISEDAASAGPGKDADLEDPAISDRGDPSELPSSPSAESRTAVDPSVPRGAETGWVREERNALSRESGTAQAWPAADPRVAGQQGSAAPDGLARVTSEGGAVSSASFADTQNAPSLARLAEMAPDGNLTDKELRGDLRLPRDVLIAERGSATESRGAQAQSESVILTRSRADWLRSGIGSDGIGFQGIGQIAARDAPGDEAVELLRGASLTTRSDGAATTAPPATGLAPAPVAATSATSTAAQLASTMPEYALSRAPDDPEFPGELTARMKTLLRDGVREARLQLHPAELGRLQVTVTTEGDQARVVFVAETSAARDAIEQSMPRLREMLEQNGLQLAQSDVDQRQYSGESQGDSESREGVDEGLSRQLTQAGDGPEDASAGQLISLNGRARIDTYI